MKNAILFALITITLFLVFGDEAWARGGGNGGEAMNHPERSDSLAIKLGGILALALIVWLIKDSRSLHSLTTKGERQDQREERLKPYPLVTGVVTAIELIRSGTDQLPHWYKIKVAFEDGREGEIELDRAESTYFRVGRRVGGRFKDGKLFTLRPRMPR